MNRAVTLTLLLALAPSGAGAGAGPIAGPAAAVPSVADACAPAVVAAPVAAPASLPHELHVTYGSAAVEGSTLVVRVRIFKDDLEAALSPLAGGRPVAMAPEPTVDSLFLRYMGDRLTVTVAGARLRPRILARGEDELDRESVWWYTIQFEAPAPLTAFRLRNTLLLEHFRDQRNIVKVVRFPDEKQLTFSFAAGEEEVDVKF